MLFSFDIFMGHVKNPPDQNQEPLTDRGYGLGVTVIVKYKLKIN